MPINTRERCLHDLNTQCDLCGIYDPWRRPQRSQIVRARSSQSPVPTVDPVLEVNLAPATVSIIPLSLSTISRQCSFLGRSP